LHSRTVTKAGVLCKAKKPATLLSDWPDGFRTCLDAPSCLTAERVQTLAKHRTLRKLFFGYLTPRTASGSGVSWGTRARVRRARRRQREARRLPKPRLRGDGESLGPTGAGGRRARQLDARTATDRSACQRTPASAQGTWPAVDAHGRSARVGASIQPRTKT
jgi:hypothetical protein